MSIYWDEITEAKRAEVVAKGQAGSGVMFRNEGQAQEYVAACARAPRDAFAKLPPHEQERRMSEAAAAQIAASAKPGAPVVAPIASGLTPAQIARLQAARLPLTAPKGDSWEACSIRAAMQLTLAGQDITDTQRRQTKDPALFAQEEAARAAIERAYSDPSETP